ncbi:MAG TPA: hypothetical protein EYQ73_01330 [Candidatus Poseidoniales archaeon]|jgi:uncharacterized Rossmann fold enzyme|nr:MAG: hypothetical protein CXT71_02395 [Euryarchaeota archaeon]HIF45426.1 hypothetical protein [Candidatus Poseidoniales archaeon]HIL64551.1 hypothetical protein [Candidatus Poseidoniales archaeon]
MQPVNLALVAIQDEIRTAFSWPLEDDLESAHNLSQACENPRFEMKLSGMVTVVGAAADAGVISSNPIIAADGALGACADLSRVILVVSDADGEPYLDRAIEAKIPICLHAHGDNQANWGAALRRWPSDHPIILTHQTPLEIENMFNPGGFTDGDRAVCIAFALGAKEVELVGFDTKKVGQWSGNTNPEGKIIKLQWMERVLSILGLEV